MEGKEERRYIEGCISYCTSTTCTARELQAPRTAYIGGSS